MRMQLVFRSPLLIASCNVVRESKSFGVHCAAKILTYICPRAKIERVTCRMCRVKRSTYHLNPVNRASGLSALYRCNQMLEFQIWFSVGVVICHALVPRNTQHARSQLWMMTTALLSEDSNPAIACVPLSSVRGACVSTGLCRLDLIGCLSLKDG